MNQTTQEKSLGMTFGSTKVLHPGKHPDLAAKLKDEAARLREKAREVMRTPAPAAPGTDRTETFAKLWTEGKAECGLVADRLGDAARVLDDAAGGVSPTHDLVTWRR